MLSRNKGLTPSVGYGKIGGVSDGQQPPDDGLTYVNGVPAQLDIHVFDKIKHERIMSTRSGTDGSWTIDGLSTTGGFYAVFENKTHRDTNGDLIESAIRYDLKAAPIPQNEMQITGIRNASPFSDGVLYEQYPNTFTVNVNAGTKNIFTSNEVVPAGMELTAGYGRVTVSGSPIERLDSYTISFEVEGELYQTVFERRPQKRGYDPKLLLSIDFNQTAGTTSIPYRIWNSNSTVTLNGTNSNGITNAAPYSAELNGALDLTSGTGLSFAGNNGNALTKQSGGVIEFVIKPTMIQTSNAIIFGLMNQLSSSPNSYLVFYLQANTNRLMMGTSSSLSGNFGLDLGITIPTDTWTHIMISQDCREGVKNRLFVNGAFAHDNVPDMNWLYQNNYFIGAKNPTWSTAWTGFRGYIASVALYTGLPVQYSTFEKRTKPFVERGYTEICSDFTSGYNDKAWADWSVTAGSPSFSDGLVITPGTVVSTATDIYLPQSGMIEFYVTPTTIGTFQAWLGASNNSNYRFECGITAAGQVWFARRSFSESTAEVKTTTTLTAGVEYHIAVCYDGPRKTHKIFINGVESASYTYGSNSSSITSWLQFNIGQGRNNTTTGTTQTRTMDAKIRGLRVVAGTGYYESNFTPPTFANMVKPIYAVYPEFWTPDFAATNSRDGAYSAVTALDIPHRYWRVFVTENGGSGGAGIGTAIHCGELEMYQIVGGTNVAIGATPMISSAGSGVGTESRLNDGLTTPAVYTGAPLSEPWFGYDFGADPEDWKAIHHIRYFTGSIVNSGTRPRDYTIQRSKDNVSWEDVYSGTWGSSSTNVWLDATF